MHRRKCKIAYFSRNGKDFISLLGTIERVWIDNKQCREILILVFINICISFIHRIRMYYYLYCFFVYISLVHMQIAKFASATCFATFWLHFWGPFKENEVILFHCIGYSPSEIKCDRNHLNVFHRFVSIKVQYELFLFIQSVPKVLAINYEHSMS